MKIFTRREAATENQQKELKWQLRVSTRARYAKLQIKPFGGLEVVIPPRFPRHQVAALVARHAPWIHQQLANQAKLRESVRLPHRLLLAFDNSSTTVVYATDPRQYEFELFDETGAEQVVIHAESQAARIRELRQWIRRKARASLPGMLRQVSSNTGLEFNKLSIRSQKTRWGSCSARGNINLNDQLLFLPRSSVEYLMIHELCHTRHLNHSKAYWSLVEQHCTDYRAHEDLLSASRDRVPDWFLLDLYR
ncbi:MAG: M48 family metallopeptidase [Gammaproteobacteria bacterium]|nr:M48 family metallopeptidase [Gammaproteobacteria bacterium]